MDGHAADTDLPGYADDASKAMLPAKMPKILLGDLTLFLAEPPHRFLKTAKFSVHFETFLSTTGSAKMASRTGRLVARPLTTWQIQW